MVISPQTMLGTAALFVAVFVLGFWLRRSGKLYSGPVMTAPKLVSLALLILFILTVYRANRATPLDTSALLAAVLTVVFFRGRHHLRRSDQHQQDAAAGRQGVAPRQPVSQPASHCSHAVSSAVAAEEVFRCDAQAAMAQLLLAVGPRLRLEHGAGAPAGAGWLCD
jgi:hypothetical protein